MRSIPAAILTIGNEVLKGSVLNTNAQFIGKELTGMGFGVVRQSSCRDVLNEIAGCLDASLKQADLLILSGGLGPTPDDLTRIALAKYFRRPLKFSKEQFALIEGFYRRRHKKVPSIVRREAMFPSGAVPLLNHFGIALGFCIQFHRKLVIALPGVPSELRGMFHQVVVPQIRRHFQKIGNLERLIVKTVGRSEPRVMERLGNQFVAPSFEFGIYPSAGEVALRIYSRSATVIQRLKKKIAARLRGNIYAWEEISLAEVLGKLLIQKKKTLAVAESCTGGFLSSLITEISGSSRYYKGAVIVYDNAVKKWLGVKSATLRRTGAVSTAVAKELSQKIRRHLKSDLGVAVTGIAGPATEGKKPVGLVYIAIADKSRSRVWKEQFFGDRRQIQEKASKKALEYLWRALSHK